MDQLNNLTDSVQPVHHKVVKIANQQEIFTEKVLQQADDIDRLHLDTVAATENITSGNEEVRQAIQKNVTVSVLAIQDVRGAVEPFSRMLEAATKAKASLR